MTTAILHLTIDESPVECAEGTTVCPGDRRGAPGCGLRTLRHAAGGARSAWSGS